MADWPFTERETEIIAQLAGGQVGRIGNAYTNRAYQAIVDKCEQAQREARQEAQHGGRA